MGFMGNAGNVYLIENHTAGIIKLLRVVVILKVNPRFPYYYGR
jgi:hypothetical protein